MIEIPANRLALSPEEAAQSLGVSRVTLNKWILRGQLASAKIGNRRLIRPEAIDAFLRERGA